MREPGGGEARRAAVGRRRGRSSGGARAAHVVCVAAARRTARPPPGEEQSSEADSVLLEAVFNLCLMQHRQDQYCQRFAELCSARPFPPGTDRPAPAHAPTSGCRCGSAGLARGAPASSAVNAGGAVRGCRPCAAGSPRAPGAQPRAGRGPGLRTRGPEGRPRRRAEERTSARSLRASERGLQ